MPTGLKTKISKLNKILQYAQLAGIDVKGKNSSLFEMCNLYINKKNKKITIKNIDKHKAVISIISSDYKKEDIIESGIVPIELKKVLKSLTRFSSVDIISFVYNKTISYKRTSPKLKFTKKTINIDEVKTDLIQDISFRYNKKDNYWTSNKYKYDSYFKIESKELSELTEDAKEIETYSYTFKINEDTINVSIIDDDTGEFSERELKPIEIKNNKNIECTFAIGIGNICSTLKGIIECWITIGSPMIFKLTDNVDNIEVIYILSSVDPEEEDEEEDEEETENESEEDFEEGNESEEDFEEDFEEENEDYPTDEIDG